MAADGIEFHGGGDFYADLRARVREHMADPARRSRGQRAMYLKSGVVFAWAIASYALLMFGDPGWLLGALLAVSLGFALAGIAFNITHDANHGSYSPHPWLNGVMRRTLDVLGASSHVWRVKHNVVHHTFTNISGADADIEQMPFFRCTPDQPRRWMHRWQHLYAWPLYAMVTVRWQLVGDLHELHVGNVEGHPLPWPRRGELAWFWTGKALFLVWAVVLPLVLHPVWQTLAVFALASLVFGLTLAVVFQLAHNIDEAEVTDVEQMRAQGRVEWARHQVETTVDFAPRSRLARWYLGGLNFQIEHHLFSRVCHVHYPGIAGIVRATCAEHGIEYRCNPTLMHALGSHARWLRTMGRAPATVEVAGATAS